MNKDMKELKKMREVVDREQEYLQKKLKFYSRLKFMFEIAMGLGVAAIVLGIIYYVWLTC